MSTTRVFDALLVLQYQSGDKKALGILVNKYHAKLCRHSYWYVKDVNASQDIVQDSWSIIINKLNTIRDANTFECWAMRIVTRRSIDFLKKEKTKKIRLKTYNHLKLNEEEPNEDKDKEIKKLNRAVGKLSQNQQVVLRLFYTEDYSMHEISEILEISIGTVKSRLFHAREKLKTILK
ncbi:RNA polymerase sigma factor [Maribacter aestuarii]|uniref:RNA polymerase sigma factor n=1 Tax=Maribacter aestuarii TaxID=1130723 RepID=UPI00248C7DF9|nr:RNA polymerase sigma factor [Maribacter aestuarii]